MADIIEINIAALKHDIEEMKAKAEAVRKEMNRTFSQVKELDAMWDGPANDAFNRTFDSDRKKMEEMIEIINGLISYMENARDEYIRCEAAVSGAVDAIRL